MPEVRLIDANALHDNIMKDYNNDLSKTENIAQFLLRLETAPTIDAQPVRYGQWQYDLPNAIFVCSECHMMYRDNPNYCPRCGADMRGGDDNV